MHVRRLALVAGWAVMSLFTAAGFAAFGGSDTTSTTTQAAFDPSIGRQVGSVVALAFGHDADSSEPPSAEPNDVEVINDLVPVDPTTPATAASTVKADTTKIGRVLTEKQMRHLIERYFKDADVERAMRIAFCESKFDSRATNSRSGAAGLFQHLPKYWKQRSSAAGWRGASIYDVEANVAVAAWLRDEFGGWSHWTCR